MAMRFLAHSTRRRCGLHSPEGAAHIAGCSCGSLGSRNGVILLASVKSGEVYNLFSFLLKKGTHLKRI